MNFIIDQEGKQIPNIKLKFEHSGDDVNVIGSDGDNEYFLVSFNSDGTLYRHNNIDPCTGFNLNKNGQIKERK